MLAPHEIAEARMTVTPGERTALRFLAGIALLGAGVQVAGQWRHRDADAAETRESLQRQIAAVDSARLAKKEGARRAAGGARPRGRGGRTQRVASADSLPPVGASVGYGAGAAPPFRMFGELPAGAPAAGRGRGRGRGAAAGAVPAGAPVDVDRASAAELEALPRVGPALAARIVADRGANGAFGSIEGLLRVRGVGPGLVRLLGPLVTFSGQPRPTSGR